jgi:hypothetical protein
VSFGSPSDAVADDISDIVMMDAVALAGAIRARRVSCADVMTACARRGDARMTRRPIPNGWVGDCAVDGGIFSES